MLVTKIHKLQTIYTRCFWIHLRYSVIAIIAKHLLNSKPYRGRNIDIYTYYVYITFMSRPFS